MATIFEVLENAKRASEYARGVVVGIIEDHEDIITGYNKDQLIHGQDRNGDPLEFYKNLHYAIYKNQRNPKAGLGTPDLNLTGAFYRGFFLSINGFAFSIDSSNSKSDALQEKYGEMIFGLSQPNMGMYARNEFFEEFKRFIENTLKLRMQ